MGLDFGECFSLITERIPSGSTRPQFCLLPLSQRTPVPPGNSARSHRLSNLDLGAGEEPQESILRLKAYMLSRLENSHKNSHIK